MYKSVYPSPEDSFLEDKPMLCNCRFAKLYKFVLSVTKAFLDICMEFVTCKALL